LTEKRLCRYSHNRMSAQRTAIISGGMGDIGRAIARRLAKDGFRVCVLYHTSSSEEASEFLKTLPGDSHTAFACDITNPEETHAVVDAASADMGGLQVGIHAAVAPLVRARATSIEPGRFKEQFEVTTFGGLNFFQAMVPHLRAQKTGHLVGITTAALDTDRASGMAGYVCAKYALRGLLRELQFELGPAIKVHEVAPGFVPTKLHADLPEAVRAFVLERAPIETADAVADTVCRLVQP